MSRIGVIGTGSWGTALALVLAKRGGHSITMWSHTPVVAEAIRQRHENSIYLPGLFIPDCIGVTTNLQQAVDDAEILILAVPSEHLRSICCAMAPLLTSEQLIVNATKGIEDGTYLRMTQVMGEVLGEYDLALPCGVLSGPSFAQEVGAGSPTAITIASCDPAIATRVQEEFSSPTLRLYTNEDVVGVELGGALKNVIAIAAGATYGLELGHNSVAALITRGIAEITRLAVACGGRRETLAGPVRPGRSGTHLYRSIVAQSPCWPGVGQWPLFEGNPRRTCMVELRKASAPPTQRLASPAGLASKCPSLKRLPPYCTSRFRPRKPCGN